MIPALSISNRARAQVAPGCAAFAGGLRKLNHVTTWRLSWALISQVGEVSAIEVPVNKRGEIQKLYHFSSVGWAADPSMHRGTNEFTDSRGMEVGSRTHCLAWGSRKRLGHYRG